MQGPDSPAPPEGRILTFYSYKGGTGRSMALANIAWILASAGNSVLAIDWDLEAPGLHRYLHPFLPDPDLARSDGLIDFLLEFSAVAVAEGSRKERGDEEWFLPCADLGCYAQPVDYVFRPVDGRRGYLDFISAGRQSAQYAARVSHFDWDRFFTVFGGGVFLEGVKAGLRANYDYILIDSRTGVSDTAGICTVQMPDDLVVCFTLNRQSLAGAAAVARSAFDQRNRSAAAKGRAPLRIWPVPTRIEDAEKRQRDRMQMKAMRLFDGLLAQVPPPLRERYWGEVAVRYQPFYAYEEVLAVFGDRPHSTGSMLSAMEAITRHVTDGRVPELAPVTEAERLAALERYKSAEEAEEELAGPERARAAAPSAETLVFVCHAAADLEDPNLGNLIEDLGREIRVLTGGDAEIWMDARLAPSGEDWSRKAAAALGKAKVVLAILSPFFLKSDACAREIEAARGMQRFILPVPWVAVGQHPLYRQHPIHDIGPLAIGATPGRGLRDIMRFGRQSPEYLLAISRLAEAILARIAGGDAAAAPQADPVRERMRALAARYAEVRASMPASHRRTQIMDGIGAEMRDAAREAHHLLPELMNSTEPGERLAAITILQVQPQMEHLPWLVGRIGHRVEKPFVNYHAAVALRMAAAKLPPEDLPRIKEYVLAAVERARSRPDSARDRMLHLTLQEIENRPASLTDAFYRAFVRQESHAGHDMALSAFGNLRRMADVASTGT